MKYLRGARLHATFYTLLVQGPKTMEELMQITGCCRVSASHFLRLFHERSGIHIHSWRRPYHSKLVPVWALGKGDDARCEAHCWYPELLPRARPSLIAFFELVQAMQRGPCTRDELCEASGLHFNTVRNLLRWWVADKTIYIADWAPASHLFTPAYAFGNCADKSRPKRMKNTELSRRYRNGSRAKLEQLQILHALAANANHFAMAQGA